jgi:hypothetical protein
VLAIDNAPGEVAGFLALVAADPALVGTTVAIGKGLRPCSEYLLAPFALSTHTHHRGDADRCRSEFDNPSLPGRHGTSSAVHPCCLTAREAALVYG